MSSRESDICEIAIAARSLWERLEDEAGEDIAGNPADLERRLAQWRQAAAGGDERLLQRRLEWDGIDGAALARIMSNASEADGVILDRWVETLSAIVGGEAPSEQQAASGPLSAVVAMVSALPARHALNPHKPLPFEDVWVPALGVARRKLIDRLSAVPLRSVATRLDLTGDAYTGLERDLLQRLAAIGEQALYREFRRERSGEQELRLIFLGTDAAAGKRMYDEFVQRLCAERLLPLFRTYPVLARLAVTAVDQWVEATGEFIERLSLDAAAIEQTLAAPADSRKPMAAADAPRAIVGLRLGLSDPHNGGRGVIAVHFGSGLAVVYKPKRLATEVAFNAFLEWCNAHGASTPFRALRCLDRGEYGWEEYVEHRPCGSTEESLRFYQRAGALLCVLYVLRVTDCHRENLIACGEFPMLVDGETVMHPEPRAGEETPSVQREEADFLDSVLNTGLLPGWHLNAENRLVIDISALGSSERDQARVISWQWHAINTDDMYRSPDAIALPVSESAPTLDEAPTNLSDHVEAMVRGFSETYRNLVRHRVALLAPGGPIERFRGLPVRFILRPTLIYAAILQKALTPECLADGVDRSLALDAMARAFLDGEQKPGAWPIVVAVRRALDWMDVPYFLAPCDSADLPLEGGGRVDGYFQAPSLAQVISRIGSMDDADLELQTMIIRGTFAARAARPVQGTRPTVPENGDASARAPLSRNELVNEARAIAEQVCASALRAPDGALHWLGLREIEGASRYRLTPLDDSLYDGNCGIALFLATVAHIEKTSEFRDQALAAIARVRSCLNGPGAAQALVRRGAIGGGLGLGSIIYALARIGNLLGEESVLSDVQRAAEMLTDERIAEDCYFDVMAGAAGAILGLLAAERVIGTGTALERAVACGRSLLDRRMAVNGSGRAWQSPAGVPLTGLSHGAAGIAYALLRLYEVTRADEFLQAAEEGIGYERSVFDAASGNWPDLRDQSADGGAPRFAFGWCHGAPGIGLARLGSLGVFDDEAVRAEVDAALRTTIACGAEGVDHLCCGTMGRFETLAVAAAELERDDLRILAETNAAAVVQRARETGAYRLPGLAGEAISPSLFCGLSGIGYQLLRLGYPDQIPSVLLWK